MIVTIDGPAGAGKSSVAQALAQRLGFRFLDTGATYRVLTLAAIERQIPLNDTDAIGRLAATLDVQLDGQRVVLAGRDVSQAIRAPQLTQQVRQVADNQTARRHLVQLQRRLAGTDHVVTEGRDQGTVVFPDAAVKFFLTAPARQRARRRWLQLQARGEAVCEQTILEQQEQRDAQDRQREFGGLQRADDAITVETGELTQEQVVDQLESIVRARLTTDAPPPPSPSTPSPPAASPPSGSS